MPLPQVCVAYLLRAGAEGPELLLGRKKRGIGAGKLVGLGGKLEPGEHPRRAAVREISEEAGVFVEMESLRHTGLLTYLFPTKLVWSQESWVYLCSEWIGEPVETDEIAPEWWRVAELPYARMWSDARYWLPDALRGEFIRKSFVFGADLSSVVASDDPSTGLPSAPPPGTLG